MLANLTPAQEPVAWLGAVGVLLNAVLVAVFVFAPRFGLILSSAEQAALGGIVNGALLVVGAILVRGAVTPNAPPPPPPALKANA